MLSPTPPLTEAEASAGCCSSTVARRCGVVVARRTTHRSAVDCRVAAARRRRHHSGSGWRRCSAAVRSSKFTTALTRIPRHSGVSVPGDDGLAAREHQAAAIGPNRGLSFDAGVQMFGSQMFVVKKTKPGHRTRLFTSSSRRLPAMEQGSTRLMTQAHWKHLSITAVPAGAALSCKATVIGVTSACAFTDTQFPEKEMFIT